MTQPFSIGGILRESWEVTRKHFGFLTGALTVALLLPAFVLAVDAVPFALDFLGYPFSPALCREILLSVTVAIDLLATVVLTGFSRALLRIVRGEAGLFGDLSGQFGRFWKIAGLYAICILPAFFLEFLPFWLYVSLSGVFLVLNSTAWSQVFFSVADRGTGPIESIRRSLRLTRGVRWRVFGFCALLFGINLLGALPLLLGTLVTVPLSFVAMAVLYEKLRLRAESPPPPVFEAV